MCGIVGYIGPREAQDVLLSGLEKLEYRGYDSAGIAVLNDHKIKLEKRKGELHNLSDVLKTCPLEGHLGIGHTRWATHGQPSDKNAHPHLGPEGKIAVVHNGIIENYQYLKDTYLQGHTFKSETDTEVVAHLIELFYQGDLYSAVQRTLAVITGSYALVVMCSDHPDQIIVSRKNSPLVIGLGDGENIVASDVPAMLQYTRRCIYLESGEIAQVYADRVVVTDLAGNVQNPIVDEIEWDAQSAEKGGYPHFMIKEIYEQIETFKQVLSGRIHADHIELEGINLTKEDVCKWRQVYIVACGTAYHAGLVGKTILEKTLKIPVFVEVASEFRYREPMMDEHTLVIVISQSGETADTLEGAREAKASGATVLAITNVVGSSIARESDMVVYLWAGPEISVASTKAYTSMLIALYIIGFYLGDVSERIHLSEHEPMLRALEKLPEQAAELLSQERVSQIVEIAKEYVNVNDIFYIGRGMDWAIAQEGALKLKEISYIHAEAYAAGELKHGTLALISSETPVITVALQKKTFDKTMSNTEEMISRMTDQNGNISNAKVLAVVQEGQKNVSEKIDHIIEIPECPDFIAPVLAAIPLQLIAYFTALERGCNIDKPRNLAKSVTVE
ncbi:MAG: glutamine--fructose-6-phosphate transaminase (isomerizing) [Peptococcaceae bacterium]|jgi:glucosamine--fructose-6-phosphate aminotransferase (isomerizing)|nr:glutamine--fructose-6-phosphate transaminase (isomerizing) [Peptococcaceae bacterium]